MWPLNTEILKFSCINEYYLCLIVHYKQLNCGAAGPLVLESGNPVFFPHSPWRWSCGSSDGHFLLLLLILLLLLLHTTNFPGNSRQSSDPYLFLLHLLLFPGAFLSGELSTSCLENCPQTPDSPVTPISLQYSPALGWI